MTFLASLRPIMRGSAAVTITLTAAPSGALAVLVSSKLEKFDPETTDQARAALQAALALPLRIVIPSEADPDAEFAAALTRYDTARAPVVDDLQTLLETLAQAQQTAKAATAKKDAAKPAAKADKKGAGTKAATATAASNSASESSDDESGDDDAGDASEGKDAAASSEVSASTDAVSLASPAPASAGSLFD